MAAKIIQISKINGWVNLTEEASLNAGDHINIQNIGSGAVYISSRELEPVDKNDIDYLLSPSKLMSLNVPDVDNIWAFTGGFRSTKLAVIRNELNPASDVGIRILNKLDALLETTLGITTDGFKSFSIIMDTPPANPGIFGFTNESDRRLSSEFLISAANSSNSMVGLLDIQGNLIKEAMTGGADFDPAEICAFRGSVSMAGKKNPTNSIPISQFERLFVPANGGSTTETVSKFLIEPGETAFFQAANLLNISHLAISARFGRG